VDDLPIQKAWRSIAKAAKIDGCVFLGRNYDASPNPAFDADGEVKFTGTSIGLQFNCQGGRFRNANPDPFNDNYAGTALNLGVATIKDTLYLGVEEERGREPATVKGHVNLTAASVRVLVDDQFVGDDEKKGLLQSVKNLLQVMKIKIKGLLQTAKIEEKGLLRTLKVKVEEDGKEVEKELACHLLLDNFTYERVAGDKACDSSLRKKWLACQPREHLKDKFRPQPFEQLVKVLRAMGHDKNADKIGLSKRWHVWHAKLGWSFRSLLAFPARLGELVFLLWFLGYGYRVGRARVILLILGLCFGWLYKQAFEQDAIVPSYKEFPQDKRSEDCKNLSASKCPKVVEKVVDRL